MSRYLMYYIYYRIKELCIKLVIKTSLHYDARSEKHQIVTKVSHFLRHANKTVRETSSYLILKKSLRLLLLSDIL
jgi:hypothetical protein